MIINFEKSSNYAKNLFKIEDEKILEIEKKAIEEKVPIITREVLNYMLFLARNIKAKNILEIGSAIGYSSIFLSKVSKENKGRLLTIEIDENRYKEAKLNFEKLNIDNIDILHSDALDILPKLKEKFDFIFIDAAKSKYIDFFNYSYSLLNEGGIIFIDNLMFRGLIAEEIKEKKYKTIINNLNKFIIKLNNEYNFVLLPFGDGVGIVVKNREEK